MNRAALTAILILALGLGALFGAMYFLGGKNQNIANIPAYRPTSEQAEEEEAAVAGSGTTSNQPSSIQQELDATAQRLAGDLRSESRLNLNLLGQLRAYREMVRQLDTVAKEVDRNLSIIGEITKEKFQQDVRRQASLFAGKKPEVIADHMEEYPASRVGAILAKMKAKEASAVLDIWASQKAPRVSAFYREVMSAYLDNVRYDENPALFKQVTLGQSSDDAKTL